MADILTRDDILDKAKSIINGERQGSYGAPENSFNIIAKLWSGYLDKELTPADVANLMILIKVARNANGVFKDDNWIDICGYAAIGGEIQGFKEGLSSEDEDIEINLEDELSSSFCERSYTYHI